MAKMQHVIYAKRLGGGTNLSHFTREPLEHNT